MNDAEIVARVRAGDTEAYTHLVDRYRNGVYGLAYYHLQNFEDARDIAQEALIAAYQHLGELREPGKFGPWLRQLTVNACRMQRRRRKAEPPADTAADVSEFERAEDRLLLRQALACLSEPSRLTITLFYLHAFSLREAADFLEVPVTTIKSRLRNARLRLHKEMTSMAEELFEKNRLPADFTAKVAFIQAVIADDADRVRRQLTADPNLVHIRTRGGLWQETFPGDDPEAFAPAEQSLTPLHLAANHNAAAAAETLLDFGADIEARGYEGNMGLCTPLHLAAFSGADRIAVVRTLLARGANPNVVSSTGSTPLATAAAHDEPEICAALIAAGAQIDFHTAVALDRMDLVAPMLAADPNLIHAQETYFGYTPLASAKTEEMRRYLHAKGAQPGIVEAALLGLTERVAALLQSDPALVNARDLKNRTPLHVATDGNHPDMVQLLLSHGADLEAEWVPGWTPLKVAIVRNKPEIAALLRKQGAKEP